MRFHDCWAVGVPSGVEKPSISFEVFMGSVCHFVEDMPFLFSAQQLVPFKVKIMAPRLSANLYICHGAFSGVVRFFSRTNFCVRVFIFIRPLGVPTSLLLLYESRLR